MSIKDLKANGGTALFDYYYSKSVPQMIEAVYPFHKWFRWKFSQNIERGYWNNDIHQRDFLDWLGNQLNFKLMQDWCNLSLRQIVKNGGLSLLAKYGNSPSKLVTAIYPSYVWQKPNGPKRRGYWKSNETQRTFLDTFGKQVGFTKMEDWYSISWHQLQNNGGGPLLVKYGGSPSKLVMNVYNLHPWDKNLFSKRIPRQTVGFFDSKSNRINLVHELEKELNVQDLDDWYRISFNQIKGYLEVFQQNPLEKLLPEAYPEHKWDLISLQKRKNASVPMASQRWLRMKVQELFPQSGLLKKIETNTLKRFKKDTFTLSFFTVKLKSEWN
jgi:hypothetical protein